MKPALRFALCVGDFVVFSLLNVHGLARWLTKHGKKSVVLPVREEDLARAARSDFPYLRLLGIETEQGLVCLGPDMLMLAATEFWMPETFEVVASTWDPRIKDGYQAMDFPNIGRYAWD